MDVKDGKLCQRRVPKSLIKPFHARFIDLRHPMADGLALQAWLADFDLLQDSVAARPLHTLTDRRNIYPDSGEAKWEYRKNINMDPSLLGYKS